MRILLGRKVLSDNPVIDLAASGVGAISVAQRALRQSFKSQIIAGSGFTLEGAEIMLELYLARHDQFAPLQADSDGFVPFRDLRTALGYSAGLLSRRIKWLSNRHLAESKRAIPDVAKAVHGNCQKLRITDLGMAKMEPIWRLYRRLADRLTAGVSQADLETHYRINKIITDKLHASRFVLELSDGGKLAPLVKPAAHTPSVKKSVPSPHTEVSKPAPATSPEPTEEFLD